MWIRFLISLSWLVLTITLPRVHEQANGQTISFPTYQQIKPSHSEIIDQVTPKKLPATHGQVIITRASSLNLYDYPAGTVTYYLNEQPTTDVNYVKKVLATKSIVIETIAIEPPTESGKRTIRIKYEAR
ncbi:hypothetical protein [Spirosoma agri]|uniref:Uncharacterized protein n=1 Tax=Spirosoma agri TaxID=1987381 RepID=A0A6M0IK18_9BACT|nr:hypothetical protein [Spirosoma agri]NEU68207.1 hypothetical protein [Spirosoma agri]